MTPSPCDAVVFDLDGTLIDSAPGLHMAATAMLARLDRPTPDLSTLTRFGGIGAAVLGAKCLEGAGGDSGRYPAALAHFVALPEDDPLAGVTASPGGRDMLATLSARA